MNHEDDELTLRRLRGLPVLQPEAARSERVQRRCRAALASMPSREVRARAGRMRPTRVGAFLTGALFLGLVAGMIQDVLLVYLRQ